jgi:2-hydroxycyclohexanecarboxyl-CoA dehydrogenase
VKVALVTGAAAGIGAAISRRLARDGIAIGVLDVLIDNAAKVAEEIVKAGGKAIALQADISDREQVKAAVAKLRAAFGPVTIVVNNAGITGNVAFEDLTDAQWDKMFTVNVKGTFIVTQVVVPDMKAAGWGRIVNISSSVAQGNFSKEAIINAGPIRRQGEPEDIAGACAWLVSDEAGYVTGQTIGVNGGRYI